ncbi:MAG: chemotaxis protein CheD [Candidatus Coatesbacteria bacterium]|nr:chemotaxis protein CheD [Candidatus Coatesbacteria bacterium]
MSIEKKDRIKIPAEIKRLKIGAWHFDKNDSAVSTIIGLGSCIGLVLFDPVNKFGLLSHLMLPKKPTNAYSDTPDLRYIKDAVPFFVDIMEKNNAREIIAKAVGGATLFKELQMEGRLSVGERNIIALHESLDSLKIPLVAKDLDKEHGRTIFFFHNTGHILIRSYKMGENYI